MGGVALLLWGLHMVHSGIVRAYGSGLRRFLGKALRNRFLACGAGILVTALLQSSTATGLMTTSFVSGGAVDLVPALAIMLGANVGTTQGTPRRASRSADTGRHRRSGSGARSRLTVRGGRRCRGWQYRQIALLTGIAG
jgi:hypothetical protein